MNINPEKRFFSDDSLAIEFISHLEHRQEALNLNESEVYYKYPLYRDLDGDLIRSHILIISRYHGVLVIRISNATDGTCQKDLPITDANLGDAFNQIYSRLIKNKHLKKGKKDLLFPVETVLYSPLITPQSLDNCGSFESQVLTNGDQVADFLMQLRVDRIPDEIINNILSSIDGAGGMIRAKPRVDSIAPGSKGDIANKLEAEILTFDRKQKNGYILPLHGIERIRGLAGSGKTVVLAMKAALTHLEKPDATILFTFYTKSLYQHIQRLITRFYKQFSEFEPDFDKIKIMHAWGGYSIPGVYYQACVAHGTVPVSYDEARRMSHQPFDYVCKQFLNSNKVVAPLYDYVFIDEGQDFPSSFIKLCGKISSEHKLVLAYDELQTIFQPTAPSYADLFGDTKPNVEDIVLYKCYRNPREVIVCAHALGFGLYSSKIVQMLENKEHWEDVGYVVHEGDFIEGSNTVIERPVANSLGLVSEAFSKENIVICESFKNLADELDFVVGKIIENLKDGLRPDDILVEVVDDRNAKGYLRGIEERLLQLDVQTHNVHVDTLGFKDFHKEGCVTLSTVHKAKGNESFMVYVVGVDALFGPFSGVRDRNVLFTAMTRAKGWVCISGVGHPADICKTEVQYAMANFPYLRFKYPSEDELKVMKRDLQESDIKKQKIERMLDEMLSEMSLEEAKNYLEQKFKTKKSKRNRTKK